jgi:hypothetical protein
MTPYIVALVFVFAGFLMIWKAARMHSLQRDYGYQSEFPGKHYPCELRSADAESAIRCLIGASDSALYLMADPEVQRKVRWWQQYQNYDFRMLSKTGLRIPWNDLECRAGKMFFKEVIWFENRPRRFYIYIPRAVAETVLSDARRPIPAPI